MIDFYMSSLFLKNANVINVSTGNTSLQNIHIESGIIQEIGKNGIKNNLISDEAIVESLMAFKRAGASAIVSYFALDIAKKI